MKKFTTLFLIYICCAINTKAQESPVNKGFGFGFQLGQYQKDFGFGLNVTSPSFAHDNITLRMRGNVMYYENLKNGEVTWTPYSNVSLGLIGVGGYISENIRLYGEGGVLSIFPSGEFSKESVIFGGYGLFGFEFFMHRSFNYFIEIGGVGIGATADKIPTKPIYSNGLVISAGFRTYLP